MKLWKLLVAVSIIFLMIGVVSAANVDDFTVPSPLSKLGTGNYADGVGHNMMIVEDTDSNHETWFENDTTYIVQKYNDTCYIGADDDSSYILEIVEKNGDKYIINSWSPNGPNEASELQKNLQNFNEINHIQPVTLD